ncbi:MAG: hypothetical protein JWP18_1550 [Solirubrobacterales bacterium]|nr:hypothetical protein [Solirubrobacterales bacterium]
MQLGRKLHELWHLRLGLAVSVALALLATLWSVDGLSLFPPGLKSRHLEMASASTSVFIDTPRSTMLDVTVTAGDFRAITNQSLLIANVMASAPVRERIARQAGVEASDIRMSSPVSPQWPRSLNRPGERATPGDLLKLPDEYRLSVLSNPTVPKIDIYATAPSPGAAARLADGAVRATQDYLRALGARQGIPPSQQVRLEQLGTAKGGTINPGADVKFAVLSFLVVFATTAAAVLFFARVRQGWKLEENAATGSGAGA